MARFVAMAEHQKLWPRMRSKVERQSSPFGLDLIWALLASTDRRAEDVGIAAVIVSELKFRDVQRQALFADLVKATHDAALNQRPEALDCLSVNRADNVLALAVVDDATRVCRVQVLVSGEIVDAEQADASGDSFAHKFFDGRAVNGEHNAGDDVALASYRAHDGRSVLVVAASFGAAFLIPVAIAVFAADVCFIHFHDAAELLFRLDHGSADFVAHQPSGFDRTEAHVAPDLARTHALFGSRHQVDDFEPVAQRLVGVLK